MQYHKAFKKFAEDNPHSVLTTDDNAKATFSQEEKGLFLTSLYDSNVGGMALFFLIKRFPPEKDSQVLALPGHSPTRPKPSQISGSESEKQQIEK